MTKDNLSRGLDLRIMQPYWRTGIYHSKKDMEDLLEHWHKRDAYWLAEMQRRIGSLRVKPRKGLAKIEEGDHLRLENLECLTWGDWQSPYNIKAWGDYRVVAQVEKERIELRRFNDKTGEFTREGKVEGIALLVYPLLEFNVENFLKYDEESQKAKVMRYMLRKYAEKRNRASWHVISKCVEKSSLPEAEIRKLLAELEVRTLQKEQVQCTIS